MLYGSFTEGFFLVNLLTMLRLLSPPQKSYTRGSGFLGAFDKQAFVLSVSFCLKQNMLINKSCMKFEHTAKGYKFKTPAKYVPKYIHLNVWLGLINCISYSIVYFFACFLYKSHCIVA